MSPTTTAAQSPVLYLGMAGDLTTCEDHTHRSHDAAKRCARKHVSDPHAVEPGARVATKADLLYIESRKAGG